MPEYLAPGVYVEETSYRAKSIEGASTTTTGFVGPTRYGPLDEEPEVITSLVEFERTYGDRQPLLFDVQGDLEAVPNFMWHAARAFFEQGGRRLYVARAFAPKSDVDDGRAFADVPQVNGSPPRPSFALRARFPGAAGERVVRLTLKLGPNILTASPAGPRAAGLRERDVVWISDVPLTSPPTSPPLDRGWYYVATRDVSTGTPVWAFEPLDDSPPRQDVELAGLQPHPDPERSDEVRVVTLTVTVFPTEEEGFSQVWEDLPLDPGHEVAGREDSFWAKFAERPENREAARTVPIVADAGAAPLTGLETLRALFNHKSDLRTNLEDGEATEEERSFQLTLLGGDDGRRPSPNEYRGETDPSTNRKAGLVAFEDVDDISIVAAPGSTYGFENGHRELGATVLQDLIGHATRMRYRIAVLDSGDKQSVNQVRAMRAQLDSKYAALYYPWVTVLDPVTQRELNLPPSGFVAGIYARNDIERAVYKAPANEVVTGAIGFEKLINKAQQDVLNPEGVNCFRFFEGRGYRLWGARTISSDPEWKYVNLRRYFAYVEQSIDRGTQWAVFEPNGERLWANVRRTIEDFLFNEWTNGALLGEKPEKAYFVKCDRSTMTQNDLDNGRLVCLIGIAPLRPAEFVIFRIGQWTADRR
jgi:phage tail sheath protein FI